MTLHAWRTKHPDWDAEIIDAFDAGGAIELRKVQAIADGIQPLTYGKTTKAQRAQHRADVKRDRMRMDAMFKRIEAVHRKYKPRTIMEGDEDHPLPAATYLVELVDSPRSRKPRSGEEE
jgi:hypothetical protein